MEEISKISDVTIVNHIYHIRGQNVMLDSALAELYEVRTKVLNQAVNRNLIRFPPDFMFELTAIEWSNLRSQSVTSSWGGKRYLPKVFTEHGVLMLSSVLNSERAIQVNIQIVRIFSRLRQMINDNTEIKLDIEKIKKELTNQGKNMEIVFSYLDELSNRIDSGEISKQPRRRIGYKPDAD